MGSFQQGITDLQDRVGRGELVMSVVVDQPYAIPMHERHWQNFLGYLGFKEIETYHGGGGDKFLERPLFNKSAPYLAKLAANAYFDHGLRDAMIDNAEDLASEVHDNAPVRSGRLRDSAHPTVRDDGALVYDRPPVAGREG